MFWGAWVAPDSPDDTDSESSSDVSRQARRGALSPHQLVLTPLPPDTWPISFCIQLQLADKPSSMAYPTRLLGALGLNMLSVRTAPSGFHHTTWTAVCEAPELRRRVYHQTRSLRHSLSWSRSELLDIDVLGNDGATADAAICVSLSVAQMEQLLKPGAEPEVSLTEAQQQGLRESLSNALGLEVKLVKLAKPTLAISANQLEELRAGDKTTLTLSAEQIAQACLVRRAIRLPWSQQTKIWRQFALTIAEPLLLRMHEALWCLRIVSHISSRLVKVLGSQEKAMQRAEDLVKLWRSPNKADFGHLVRALKQAIDTTDSGRDAAPSGFDKSVPSILGLALGYASDTQECWKEFRKCNEEGFLHHRFLYGRSFLAEYPQSKDHFSDYAGTNPLHDVEGNGGQSLQRIVNGIRLVGANAMNPYREIAEDLIDRSKEWEDQKERLGEDDAKNLRYRLAFLLNVDAKRRIAKAADGRIMAQLMYLWIRVRGDLVRVREFKYRSGKRLLEPSGRSMSETMPNGCDLPLPLRSAVSVNSLHCVAKFFPIANQQQRRLARVKVVYEVTFRRRRGESQPIRSSAGILNLITGALTRNDATILSCSTQIADRPRHIDSTERPRDRGAVVLDVVMHPRYVSVGREELGALEAAVEQAFKAEQERKDELVREVKLISVNAAPHALTEVFISTRFDSQFWKQLKKPIEDTCRQSGFEPITLDSGDSITSDIIARLKQAHCLIQVVPLLTGDSDLNEVNLGWLHAEYMCALMRDIPAVRAVQLDRSAQAQDWLKVLKANPDQPFERFVNTTELINDTLPRMLRSLRHRVMDRDKA